MPRLTTSDFLCCEVLLRVSIPVAVREAQLISARTKAALAARKARGLTLGKPENLTLKVRLSGAATSRARTVANMRPVAAYASALRAQGLSLRAVAAQLDAYDFRTRQGDPWSAVQVKRVLDRKNLVVTDPAAAG